MLKLINTNLITCGAVLSLSLFQHPKKRTGRLRLGIWTLDWGLSLTQTNNLEPSTLFQWWAILWFFWNLSGPSFRRDCKTSHRFFFWFFFPTRDLGKVSKFWEKQFCPVLKVPLLTHISYQLVFTYQLSKVWVFLTWNFISKNYKNFPIEDLNNKKWKIYNLFSSNKFLDVHNFTPFQWTFKLFLFFL
jgi:hypothetical protein